jgi:hypothetical protein
MDIWTSETARESMHAFDELTGPQKEALVRYCNEKYPPSVFQRHRARRRRAIANAQQSKETLMGVAQKFPPLIMSETVKVSHEDLCGVAIVLTAGGDGERLKKSLMERGAGGADLSDFTKATYPLPGFFTDFGALHANLCLLASLSERLCADIPVVVTTGPAGSTTARVVPEVIAKYHRFGLKSLRVVEQEERLHLTMEETMAIIIDGPNARPVTHPDETGGPLMKLKRGGKDGEDSVLAWLEGLGCSKMMVLQATGLYDPALLCAMASALKQYDCIGAGILRTAFDAKDPFGTYVAIVNNTAERVVIVEQDIRNGATMALKDETGRFYLPYNTGLYAFKNSLLAESDLPDYATPPKEILPGLPRSPKIGYAATDIFSLSDNAAVLCVPGNSFAVIKNADDLATLTELGKRFGIDEICRSLKHTLYQ